MLTDFCYCHWLRLGDELEYFEDGEDLNFDGVMAEKHRRKLYQVDYTIQSAKHLMGSQDKEVSQVASILGKCVWQLDSGAHFRLCLLSSQEKENFLKRSPYSHEINSPPYPFTRDA